MYIDRYVCTYGYIDIDISTSSAADTGPVVYSCRESKTRHGKQGDVRNRRSQREKISSNDPIIRLSSRNLDRM
jgi:hypothetical protein